MRILTLLVVASALPFAASADLINGVILGPHTISFGDGGISDCSAGPATTTDGGFSVSTNGAACFPVYGWDFADNGIWDTLPALADNSGTTTITVDLGGSYSAVWGFMDYGFSCNFDTGCSTPTFGNDPTITALDKNMNVIETADLLPFGGLGNSGDLDFLAGDTFGFSESTPDIAYFQFGGDGIAMTDISLFTPVPEPASQAITAFALAILGWLGRRKRMIVPDLQASGSE